MEKEIKVSIIVPIFKVEKYLRNCVDSILNQTLKEIEVILVEDGSPDSCGRIADEYRLQDSRVKVIHQSNKGLGLSRNSGLDIAKGEFVGFVDSDDFVSKDMFRILYDNAKKNNADVSYCLHQKFCEVEDVVPSNEKMEIKCWSGKSEIRQYLLDRVGLPPQFKKDKLYGATVWNGIFSRDVIERNRLRFVSERLFIAEDVIFDIDCIPCCNKIVHCNLRLYYYRYNNNSLTTVYKEDRFEKNLELYVEMCNRLSRHYEKKEYFNPTARYFLVTALIAAKQEVQFSQKNGKRHALRRIKEICNNEYVRNVLNEYNYLLLPIRHKLFCLLLKRNAYGMIYNLFKIQNLRKKTCN